MKIGETITEVTSDGDGFRVDGEKHYSTGTIFAEWIDTYAGSGKVVRQAPQFLQGTGKARAFAYAARAATLEPARALRHAYEASQDPDKSADDAANIEAELQSNAAQSAVIDLALRVITDISNALDAAYRQNQRA